MTELCERNDISASSVVDCRNVVVFGTGRPSAGGDLVVQTLQYLAAEDLIGKVTVANVRKTSDFAIDARSTAIFVFLLDSRFLASAGGIAACSRAPQWAQDGALIVPVVLNANLSLDATALANHAPIALDPGANMARKLSDLESAVLAHASRARVEMPQAVTVPSSAADRLANTSQIAEVVDLLPCHMTIYDDFVEQLVSRLQIRRMKNEQRHLNLFSEALKDLFNAEMVYCYLRGSDGQLHLFEAESNRPLHGCTASMVHGVLEDALESFETNRKARSMLLKNFLPELVADADSSIECTVVVNDRLANCGVFIAASANASRYPQTEIIGTIINSLHDYFTSSESRSFEKLKARVYDDLKRSYRYVSDDMYQDRLRLFASQISHLSVQFEPILKFDHETQQVSIYAYEALAREDSTAVTAPVEVFQTANLWGMGFQSEVDKQLLKITLDAYEAQLRATGVAADDIKPLSLNVYPATLRDFEYREMLCRHLEQSEILSGHNLIMEVSEKTVVTPGMEGEPRRQLEEYRKLVRQIGDLTGGIRYAIDDFGVGNASLSRLDSLNPHYVKIDRDILSFEPRMASTLIRYLIESQPERGTSVILEGVDIHSHFKLTELVNDMGVGLVQGYCLSKAVSDINARWEQDLCNNAAEQVGWHHPAVPADTASLLH